MKYVGVVVSVLVLGLKLEAAIYNYDQHVPPLIQDYVQKIQQQSKDVGSSECQNLYEPLVQDGVLDIRYALGYFDDTTGSKVRYDGREYGYSPSLDGAIFDSLRQHFTSDCHNQKTRLCGFVETGDRLNGKLVFEKPMVLQNHDVLVRITLTQGSASESYLDNIGRLWNFQQFLIQQSEENFFDGLKMADIVFYNGHSRNGGGPDFQPPVLNKFKKTDYKNYYQVEKPGITRTLASISENPNPGFVLGLFSCYSRSHFQKMLTQQNPELRMILSADTIDYFDSLLASIGYLEGMLRGQCGDDLAKTAKKGNKIRRGYQQYNMK